MPLTLLKSRLLWSNSLKRLTLNSPIVLPKFSEAVLQRLNLDIYSRYYTFSFLFSNKIKKILQMTNFFTRRNSKRSNFYINLFSYFVNYILNLNLID